MSAETPDSPLPPDLLERLEEHLLGDVPSLTRVEVAEQAGVPLEFAQDVWRLLGFAEVGDDTAAFSAADVRALRQTKRLIDLGVIDAERQDGLVRTWGRSFARLAEWQVALLTEIALESGAPAETLIALADDIIPIVEELQSFTWRRHLLAVGSRLLAVNETGAAASVRGVCFVDIVGYTSRSRNLSDRELVAWLEEFENTVLAIVVAAGGRIIKNIGDELLIVTDTADAAAVIALELVRRGADDSSFPAVRAGVAYGDVVIRLGDVFGPVVNIAARLTSAARPNSVLVDRGMQEALTAGDEDGDAAAPDPRYKLRRVPRLSVKGYSRLHVWRLLPPPD